MLLLLLLRLIRFPSPEVLNTVRAAEIYERAISYVRHHVREGHTFNFTNGVRKL